MLHSMSVNGFDTGSIDRCFLVDIGTVQVAKPRVLESLVVYGANGSYSLTDGAFGSYERVLSFVVFGLDSVRLLVGKFRSVDNVISFEFDRGSFFYCDLVDVSYSPVGVSNFKVDFKLLFDPFRYVLSDPVVLGSSGSVNNVGDVFSEPVIVVWGQGEVSLTIGSQVMVLVLDTKATIDCRHRKQNVYDKNGNVRNTIRKRGGFFELAPGVSGVSSSGNVSRITINGNWRYSV